MGSSLLSIEDLAALLVERVRRFERNCRCGECHSQQTGPLQCIDCVCCVAMLRTLVLAELESHLPRFSACAAQQDRSIVPFMKTAKATRTKTAHSASSARKTTKAAKKMKAKMKMKGKAPRAKAKAKPRLRAATKTKMKKALAKKMPAKNMRKKPVKAVRAATPVHRKPAAGVIPISDRKTDRMDSRVFNDAREFGRRVFVRFDAPGKELVKTVAGKTGLSPYIAHFAAEAAKAGKKIVAAPASTKEAGVFARFDTPAVKKMVAKAAAECGVSLSAYAAYFAVEAAKSGRTLKVTATLPKDAKEATAAAS